MNFLYDGAQLELAEGEDKRIRFNPRVFNDVVKFLHKQGRFTDEMLLSPKVMRHIRETYRILDGAISASITQETPEELTNALRNNAFIFSGFKAYHTLSELGLQLTDETGTAKPFHKFAEDVKAINAKYNIRYLQAEYDHAVHSSQMAVKWKDFEKDGDDFNLQYRTAGDERVRAEHAQLDGVTLPPSDKFWKQYLPPNGWRCRCQVVQVLKEDYRVSDSDEAVKWGDMCTDDPKLKIFRFNPGMTLNLFPEKHPYNKVPKPVKKIVETMAAEESKEQRIKALRAQLPDNLTDAEKDAIAAHNYELEQAMGIKAGKPMTVEEADKQSANPAHVPKFLIDPAGPYYDNYAHYRLNPDYVKKRDEPNSINCQTCAPAYALRLMGFDVTAKPNTSGSKLDYLSRGRPFEVWRNPDGTPAQHTSLNSWRAKKGYKNMTPKRYLEFFDETCKEVGVYELSIGWQSGSGHATILQRFPDGTLKYIEPQHDNSAGSGYEFKDLDYLAEKGVKSASRIHDSRGIMRIDNKLFSLDFIEIFNK